MRRIEFTVHGHVPPKKDGANSMWNKPSERSRLIALRQAAAAACDLQAPLSGEIRLNVEIQVPPSELASIGDLDNFITGICDGLMAAAKNTPVESWASSDATSIHPSTCIAIRDDRYVVEIVARKVSSTTGQRSYHVILEGN